MIRGRQRASMGYRSAASKLGRDGRSDLVPRPSRLGIDSSVRLPLICSCHVDHSALDMKRSSDSLEARNTDPKRQKIVPSGDKLLRIKHRQPGALELVENSQDDSIFDRELSRAICVGLHCAGFNAVRNRALESFRGAVEECTIRSAPRSSRCRG